MIRDNNYDEYFPGVCDLSQNEKMEKEFEWAFIATVTRFLQKEFSLKMGTVAPLADCVNHLVHETTLYKTFDPEGKLLR